MVLKCIKCVCSLDTQKYYFYEKSLAMLKIMFTAHNSVKRPKQWDTEIEWMEESRDGEGGMYNGPEGEKWDDKNEDGGMGGWEDDR